MECLVKFSLFGQGPKVDGTKKKKKNIHDDMLSCCATKKENVRCVILPIVTKFQCEKEINAYNSQSYNVLTLKTHLADLQMAL